VTDGGELTCRELVELVSDYLESALQPAERARFDSHIRDCPPCRAYLEQMRTTLGLLGRLSPEDLSPDAERTLLQVFRGWKAQPETG